MHFFITSDHPHLGLVSGLQQGGGGQADLRDSDTYFGKYSTKHQAQSYAVDSNALAVANDGAALTAFERMMKISEENEHGGK